MAALVLVRHGQASLRSDDYDRLSDIGLAQSAALGHWLRATSRTGGRSGGQTAGLLARGRMRRHRETADACLALWFPDGPAPAVEEDAGFDEFDHLDVLGAHRADFREPGGITAFLAAADDANRAFQRQFSAAVERWTSGRHDGDYRESWPGFQTRCVAAMRRVIERTPPSASAWVFTSGGPIAAICQHALELSDAKAMGLNAVILNTGVSTLRHDRDRVALSGFNGVAHLDALGDANLFTHR